jgi:DNA invertase Pin-like site-specific DNA recombinase
VQREKLSDCDKLFEEKRSGTTDARPQLKQCLNYVREGDQLIVTRIDRLARSTLHLCQVDEMLREKGVDLVVLEQNIDTADATGRLLFNMLGAIGQFETEIRAERQMDGIKKAKDRGVQFGKRPALTNEQIAELREKRAQGTLIKDLMAEYGLSKATIYRYLTENAA